MKLIFVYNAKSGLSNHLMDALHKTFSPKTYKCDLCSLTYGNIGPRKEWKQFLKEVNMESEFHYKDKFAKNHPNLKDAFPAIYIKDKNYQLLVSAEEMNQCKDLSQLINKLKLNIETAR
jgi:hypothetical protein